MPEDRLLHVDKGSAGKRLDVWLVAQALAPSRAYVQRLIEEGHIHVNGAASRPSQRLRAGDRISVTVPPVEPLDVSPEDIALDILYEDEDVVVVNKPKGMVTHPAPGSPSGTLVNALLAHCDDLSGIGGRARPGIVHRLDKDTSGVLMVAKNDGAHHGLARQLREKTARRVYTALVHGNVKLDDGIINAPIARNPAHRKRMAVMQDGRPAITRYRVLERFGDYTLVEANLDTGRTHQIRVHMAYIGHPVVGDPVYGPRRSPWKLQGQALHAAKLGFVHPRTGEYLEFTTPLPADMERVLRIIRQRRPADAGSPT